MWKKKIKQKKVQFLLIGLVLLFTTAILAGCISYTAETSFYTKEYYNRDSFPDIIYAIASEHSEKYLLDNKEIMDKIEKLNYYPAKKIDASMIHDNKKLVKAYSTLIELDDINAVPWKMNIKEGNKDAINPSDNEIWVTSVYAKDQNLKLGDSITFINTNYKINLKVTAIINTSQIPSGIMGIYPFYVNKTTLSKIDETSSTYLSISFKDENMTKEDFAKILPKEIYNNCLYDITRDDCKLCFSMLSSYFGGIGTIAALVIFIVSIILIRFILKTTIMKEYRSIGVYKSLGFTSKEIIGFYLKCYSFIACIALPLGGLLGLPLSYYLGKTTFEYVGTYNISGISFIISILAIFFLFVLLIGNLYLSLRNIKNITPVDALNIGFSSTKAKMKRSLIKNAHSPFSMAVNSIFKRKGMSFMITLILMVSFYLSLLFSFINISCSKMGEHTDTWFGLPSNCYLMEYSKPLEKEVMEYLKNNEDVSYFCFGDLSIRAQTLTDVNDPDIKFNNTAIMSYQNFNKMNYETGRPPKNPNEIGVSINQLKAMNEKVGNYVKLKIGDYTGDYLITGSFSSMMQGGNNVHILNSELDRCHVPYTNNTAFISLKDHSRYKTFKKDLENRFPSLQIDKTMPSLETAIKSITEISNPITIFLVVIFVLFSLLNIINLLLMNNMENRKQFGIQKALGFTNRYICLQNTLKIFVLSCAACLLAQILIACTAGKLFYFIISTNGLIMSTSINILVTLAIFIIIFITTLLFTLPLKNISPTDLMEE